MICTMQTCVVSYELSVYLVGNQNNRLFVYLLLQMPISKRLLKIVSLGKGKMSCDFMSA